VLFGVNEGWASVLGWSVPSFMTLIGLSWIAAVGLTGLQARRRGFTWGLVMDCALAGLIVGLILARAEHVVLHWDSFSTSLGEITDLRAGGLAWRGALAGGLGGVWLMVKLRGGNARTFLDSAALAVPLMVFGGWWACEANACGYGAEVANLADYPAAWVWEARGVYGMLAPRWRTQSIGMAAAVMIFAIVALMIWRGWGRGWRLTWAVTLTVLAMTAIGFIRGDLP